MAPRLAWQSFSAALICPTTPAGALARSALYWLTRLSISLRSPLTLPAYSVTSFVSSASPGETMLITDAAISTAMGRSSRTVSITELPHPASGMHGRAISKMVKIPDRHFFMVVYSFRYIGDFCVECDDNFAGCWSSFLALSSWLLALRLWLWTFPGFFRNFA